MSNIRTRFAPSPTGLLHIGNFRTALINYIFTKKNNGSFMLRMDDTDLERSKEEYAEKIIKDLNWLGMNWDIFAKQSDRVARYEEIKADLISKSRLYPCYESQEELDLKRKMLISRGKPPVYDRSALKLTKDQIKEYESKGIKPHYRFKMLEEDINWTDMVRGETKFHGSNISDPILIRADGSMTYILCSVVDDIDYNISHILRGEDHVTNTAVQIQIFDALGAKPPIFGHTTLIKSKDSEISKRTGGFDIENLREKGVHPMALCSLFSKIGTSDPISAYKSLDEIIAEFDIDKFGRSPANYDEADLFNLNHKILSESRLDYLKKSFDIDSDISDEFYEVIKSNISSVNDIDLWWNICSKDNKFESNDQEYLKLAASLLPKDNFDQNTWDLWISKIKESTGRKGKDLFLPLRIALTGVDKGPEMKLILPFIGYDRSYKRLTS